jgi:hypothetical protein
MGAFHRGKSPPAYAARQLHAPGGPTVPKQSGGMRAQNCHLASRRPMNAVQSRGASWSKGSGGLHPLFCHLALGCRQPCTAPRSAALPALMLQLLAEVLLLQEALKDPFNQRFVLLSESCVPLYQPATIYWQLMRETRSRINTCKGWDIEVHQ